ncbi:hypothetical protein G7Z17_g1395 [Cylindrodendrum hubeiense]|uniref:Fungal N-terminal domain-containing protein n=1 Tax=Cylindrodendrum hubeiense TaxID=595255 RepID=A0A9P5LK63_9HYPO|nr:hypothetical protein G7Z17_g1395 [Cylindrodendrum hubeiense]
MDPLSIAAGAAGLVSGCAGIISVLYTWIDDTIDIDENVSSLLEEITALSRVLESVSNASAKAPGMVVAEIDPDGSLWISVRDTLGDIKSTLDKLNLLLADVLKSSTGVFNRGFLRRPTKHIRFSLRSKDINTYKDRIKSYNTAMTSALQMINVCLLIQNNSSQENVIQVLSGLKSQVRRVEFALQATTPFGAGPAERTEEDDRISRNMKQLVRVAENFHSSASTIVREGPRSTVWGGSIMGDRLTDDQVSSIQNWIPPPIDEETPYRNGSVNRSRSRRDSLPHAGTEEGRRSDSDDDIDKELARRLEELAVTNQKSGDHEKAENFYRRAIDSGKASDRSPQHLAMMRANLAYVCMCQQKWKEAEEILAPMAFEKKTHDILVYHGLHALAMVSAKGSDLDAAYSFGKRALWGKRKVIGKSDPSCWDTSALLSRICFARNDIAEAEAHMSFIPSSYFQGGLQRRSMYSSDRQVSDLDALAYLNNSVLQNHAALPPVDASEAGSSTTTGTPDVPTVLYYDQYEKVVGWGHDIANALAPSGYPKPGVQKPEWFKLHLEGAVDKDVGSISLPPLPTGKGAIDVSADYLMHLRQSIQSALRKQLGDVFNREEGNIYWCFTVPASWTTSGKSALAIAIGRAGYLQRQDRLSLVVESEAAILFSSKHGLLNVRKSDAILVVDCGQATVELMAHRVHGENPLAVSDLTAPTGDSCGLS